MLSMYQLSEMPSTEPVLDENSVESKCSLVLP